MKLTNNIWLEEMVPKACIDTLGDSAVKLLDRRLVMLLQWIRDRWGRPIMINNWADGGDLDLRGFRPMYTTIGSKYSQHKFGRAGDYNIRDVSPQESFKDIMNAKSLYIKAGLCAVEDIAYTTGWTHVDTRWNYSADLLIVKP